MMPQTMLGRATRRGAAARGFTLVELMLVVAIIGILSAIAIPAFSRYVKKSRTAEALGHISKLWSGAVAFYEADHADAATTVLPKSFPNAGNGCVNECAVGECSFPAICCVNPDRRCLANSQAYQLDGPGHPFVELGFNIPDRHFYVPAFFSTTNSVDIFVYGNLDCDTVYSQFAMRGTVINGEPSRLGPAFILNELE